jgi:hypothetical protein
MRHESYRACLPTSKSESVLDRTERPIGSFHIAHRVRLREYTKTAARSENISFTTIALRDDSPEDSAVIRSL